MTQAKSGVLDPALMTLFPSGTAAPTFPEWVANHAGLEQVLGVAGMLSPTFHDVQGIVVWDKHVADRLRGVELGTPFGNDRKTVERYFNTLNLAEFFLMAADEAVDSDELLAAFGKVLEHFWTMALAIQFPERKFVFEQANGLFEEEGPCLTFCQR